MTNYEKEQKSIYDFRENQVKEICTELALEYIKPKHESNWFFQGKISDQVSLCFRYHYQNKKVNIFASVNSELQRKYPDRIIRNNFNIELNATTSRPSKSIAKDITRKIIEAPELPELEEDITNQVNRAKMDQSHRNLRTRFLEDRGFQTSPNNDYAERYNYSSKRNGGLSTEISVTGFSFDISVADEKQYNKLVTILAKFHAEIEGEK